VARSRSISMRTLRAVLAGVLAHEALGLDRASKVVFALLRQVAAWFCNLASCSRTVLNSALAHGFDVGLQLLALRLRGLAIRPLNWAFCQTALLGAQGVEQVDQDCTIGQDCLHPSVALASCCLKLRRHASSRACVRKASDTGTRSAPHVTRRLLSAWATVASNSTKRLAGLAPWSPFFDVDGLHHTGLQRLDELGAAR
jgi:hypothetical protein